MGWFLQRLLPNPSFSEEKLSLTKKGVLIGRSKEANIVCFSLHVSRFHAKIIFKNDIPFIKDIGSSNGTYVNTCDIQKEKECRLLNGDTIGFGYPEVVDNAGCFVYRIFRESDNEDHCSIETDSSRTTFSSPSRIAGPQSAAVVAGGSASAAVADGSGAVAGESAVAGRSAVSVGSAVAEGSVARGGSAVADIARPECPSSSPSNSNLGIKRRIEVIDLSDDESLIAPPKKEKVEENHIKPHNAINREVPQTFTNSSDPKRNHPGQSHSSKEDLQALESETENSLKGSESCSDKLSVVSRKQRVSDSSKSSVSDHQVKDSFKNFKDSNRADSAKSRDSASKVKDSSRTLEDSNSRDASSRSRDSGSNVKDSSRKRKDPTSTNDSSKSSDSANMVKDSSGKLVDSNGRDDSLKKRYSDCKVGASRNSKKSNRNRDSSRFSVSDIKEDSSKDSENINGRNSSKKYSNRKCEDPSKALDSNTRSIKTSMEVDHPEMNESDSCLYADVSFASSKKVNYVDLKKESDTRLSLKRANQLKDISIDDVVLMRSEREDEKSTILAVQSHRSHASRSKTSISDENTSKTSHQNPLPGTSKDECGPENSLPGTSKHERGSENSRTDMDLSEFGVTMDYPSSDSSRLVIDEDSSGRVSLPIGLGSVRNPRLASLMKSNCATSTPRAKRGVNSSCASSSATPLKSLTATMSPIPSRNEVTTTSPLMDFDEEVIHVKEEPTEVKKANLTYTLEEDVVVLSDDGEDFPNSQLFDDDRTNSSRAEESDDEESAPKPAPEEEIIVSLLSDDSDSDSDSIDMKWVVKLSQSQSLVKMEPEDEPTPVPKSILEDVPDAVPDLVLEDVPKAVPEPVREDVPEAVSEPILALPKADKSLVPEESGAEESATSVEVSRRESLETVEGIPLATSRIGSRRSTVGPEVIEAPPMPKRRAHLRGITVDTANFLQQSNLNRQRSRSADRSRKDRGKNEQPHRNASPLQTSRRRASVREERKEKLKELSAKKKAETSVDESPKSTKKGTAKVKVTDKLRGNFLTEMSDLVEGGKRTKVPSRQAVLQMKQIPKLKHTEPSTSRSVSPLEHLNLSFDRYKPEKNGVPHKAEDPGATSHNAAAPTAPAAVKPTAQIAPRVAVPVWSPEPGSSRLDQPPLPSSDRFVRSCLRQTAAYMKNLPKKRVRFREDNLVEIKEIEAIETVKPFNNCKVAEALIASHSLQARQSKARSLDLSINDVLRDIFQWKTKWLDEYLNFKDANPQNMPEDPPAQGARPLCVLPSEFLSYDEYVEKMYPLLLVELWNGVVREWELLRQRPVTHHVCIDDASEDGAIIRVACHALYENESLCPKMGDLVVCEFVAMAPLTSGGNTMSKPHVIDSFGFVSSENRERQVRGANHMLVVKNPSAKNLVRLTLLMKNRNMQFVKEKLMLMKVVKYIRPDLRYFQALKYFKTLPLCPSILSPKADSSAFDIPPASVSASRPLIIQEDLNLSQQEAIRRTAEACFLNEPKICAIQGPPGTGKSRVTSCLVMQLLYSLGLYDKANREKRAVPRILLCAPSNAAVDVLVMRLLDERRQLERDKRFKMVRLGRVETMHPKVRDISLQELARRDVQNHTNNETTSIETDIRMAEAKLRATELSRVASRSLRGFQSHEESEEIRELKRKVSVLQNRLEQSRSAAARRTPVIKPSAERESSKKLLRNADIVAATLSSCFTKIMETVFPPCPNGKYNFECCIIDEATQCMEVQTLTPLMLGVKTLVLVGDPKQLPATVRSQNARNCGLGTSLFGRMVPCLPQAVQFLDTQYRMHPEIVSWPNRYFYKGLLRSPNSLIEGRMSPLIPYSVIKTPFRQDQNRKEVNTEEAEFVINLAVVIVKKLIQQLTTKHNLSVGIITPYQKQKQLLNSLIQRRCHEDQRLKDIVEVNTFDSFQGQEKDVIIMSCVRTDKIGFLNDPQRLNVALTRAKFSLLICGNFGALYSDGMWSNLLDDAKARKLVRDVRTRMSVEELWSLVAAHD